MNKVLIPVVFTVILAFTSCVSKDNDIIYEEITGDNTWQGALIDPIVNAESDEYPDLKGKGKLYNGVFYWEDREAVQDGLIFDVEMPEIKNGRYYFTDGEGYIEITEHKYFQLVDMDQERLSELQEYYEEAAFASAIYQNQHWNDSEYTDADKAILQNQYKNSNQIQEILVNNRSAFFINLMSITPEPYGTNIELTCELSDYGMWFPLLYHYEDEKYKLVYFEFEWEFIYEEDK